jgi:rRNA maturation RNase YbeY
MQLIPPQVEIVTATAIPAEFLEELATIVNQLTAQLLPCCSVGLKIMDDGEIRSLNRAHRQLGTATDVLSFPSGEALATGAYAGDIALSWDAVIRQSKANGNSPLAEAAALFAHAALHLAGYTHESDADHARMDTMTRRACRSIGIEVERFGH